MDETSPLLPRKGAGASRATRHAVLAALVTGALVAAGLGFCISHLNRTGALVGRVEAPATQPSRRRPRAVPARCRRVVQRQYTCHAPTRRPATVMTPPAYPPRGTSTL
jgi:hypothetical protein